MYLAIIYFNMDRVLMELHFPCAVICQSASKNQLSLCTILILFEYGYSVSLLYKLRSEFGLDLEKNRNSYKQ